MPADLCPLAAANGGPIVCAYAIVEILTEANMDTNEEVRAFITEPVLQQRLAKYLVLHCFRNSMLEDLHAGTSPSSASGDYSDVSVSSPYGVIPWPEVSRLNDDEMKCLMIDVVDRTYRFIHTLFNESTSGELLLRLAQRDPLPQWKEPTLVISAQFGGMIWPTLNERVL